jgi:putative Mg2+ transporter-C (MgtC) family protein
MEFNVIFVRIMLACLMGGLVGLEREIHGCAAGLRTHILVCIGSALFMITSIEMAVMYKHLGPVDPTRIAAQVVTGIGFLGAGAIIRYGWSIRGLTTAASIWAISAIGLACGSGEYMPAAVTTVIVLGVLFLSRIEDYMESKMHGKILEVSLAGGTTVAEVKNIIEVYGGRIRRITSEEASSGKSRRFVFDVMVYYSVHQRDIVSDIAALLGVEEVEFK